MKAEEVQRRYAAGERNFAGANLRGCSFKNQNLSGANFGGADIRGANFTSAILREATFTGATAGLQKRWMISQLLLLLLLSGLAGFLQGYFGYVLSFYLPSVWASNYDRTFLIQDLAVTASYMITIVATYIAIIRQGFTLKAFITIASAGAVAIAVAGAGAVSGSVSGAGAVAVVGTGAGAVSLAVTLAVIVAVSFAVAGSVSLAVIVAVSFAVAGSVSLAVSFAIASSGLVAGAGAVSALLLGLFVSRQMKKGHEKFDFVRTIAVAFGAIGGTTFDNADLTNANFSGALLKSTHFSGATVMRTCWTNAKKLDRARVGNSILSNPKVRELLVTGNGYSKNYEDCNLRGANLTGATLHKANLKRADLSEATLHKADLREANLAEVQAIDTNFTEAALTGACLEGWNIDHTTKLDRVDCQYVFLLEHPNAMGNRERRPHHPDQVFRSGEFEKLYKKMINVVQILLRDGINQEAFREAFQKLMEEHPDISFDSIQGIEKKGSDVLVTLEVSETADKARIAQDFLKPYEERVKQLEAENEQLKLRSADLKDIAIALANKPNHITQKVNDQSQNFKVGGDFNINATNSIVGLREISGNVTNAINQLPDTSTDEANLKELLTQLQAVLETADQAVLPEADKADALEQVKLLAEAAQKPEAEKKTLGAKAIRFLQRIVDAVPTALPTATTLVTEFNQLVPAIVTLL
jgi:uncharacterized protein YjbI with pentapeptide repeats